jgi:hypothetical protein
VGQEGEAGHGCQDARLLCSLPTTGRSCVPAGRDVHLARLRWLTGYPLKVCKHATDRGRRVVGWLVSHTEQPGFSLGLWRSK